MPEVVLTVGSPGSGKSTLARELVKDDPSWVTVCLDDLRVAIWGSKQVYHDIVKLEGGLGRSRAHRMLKRIEMTSFRYALNTGYNVVVPNTHINMPSELIEEMVKFNIKPHLVVFDTPFEVLEKRNKERPEADRVPEDFLKFCFHSLNHSGAWWRHIPFEKTMVTHSP